MPRNITKDCIFCEAEAGQPCTWRHVGYASGPFRSLDTSCSYCGAPKDQLCKDPETDVTLPLTPRGSHTHERTTVPRLGNGGNTRAPSYRWQIPYRGLLSTLRPSDDDERLIPFIQLYHSIATLTRGLGAMAQALVYGSSAKSNKDDEEAAYAYFNHAQTDMADMILQCRLLCERMGWSYIALGKMGEERYGERMQELKDKKI